MEDTPGLSALRGTSCKDLSAVCLSQVFLYSSVPFCKQVEPLLSYLLKEFLFFVSIKVGWNKKTFG